MTGGDVIGTLVGGIIVVVIGCKALYEVWKLEQLLKQYREGRR